MRIHHSMGNCRHFRKQRPIFTVLHANKQLWLILIHTGFVKRAPPKWLASAPNINWTVFLISGRDVWQWESDWLIKDGASSSHFSGCGSRSCADTRLCVAVVLLTVLHSVPGSLRLHTPVSSPQSKDMQVRWIDDFLPPLYPTVPSGLDWVVTNELSVKMLCRIK